MTLTTEIYFGSQAAKYPAELTAEILENGAITVARANKLLEAFGKKRNQTSGWRSAAKNASIPNAAKRSKHMQGQAIDLADADGLLDEWCMKNQEKLEEIGLWLEHPSATKGWCHVQIIPPKSGNRVFYP